MNVIRPSGLNLLVFIAMFIVAGFILRQVATLLVERDNKLGSAILTLV